MAVLEGRTIRGRWNREDQGETMRYERPHSMEDAVGLLTGSAGTAAILAGGSDLLVRMKGGFIEPDLIVDIKAIDGLGEIRQTAEGFSIGAAVPCAVLGENAALKRAWPGVVEAAKLIGSKQVQGRCTIVGNLCNASPAADSVPALVAAGARASIVGPAGRRTIAGGGRADGTGQDVARQGRDHRCDPARQAPAAFGRRLSALHSAHGDGHRRGQRRREPDARRGRHQSHPPAWRLAPWRRRCFWWKRPPRILVGTKAGRQPRWRSWQRPVRRPAVRSTTSAAQSNSGRKVAGVLARRAAAIAYARAGDR